MVVASGLMVVLILVLILVPIFEHGLRTPASLDFSYPDLDYLSDSDLEFMAKLPPKTDPAIALKVRKIVADHAGTDINNIWPETRFAEDLGF